MADPHELLSSPSSPWVEIPSQIDDLPSDTSLVDAPSCSPSPSPIPRLNFSYPSLRIPSFRRVTGPTFPRAHTSDGIVHSQSRSTSLRSLVQEGKRVLMGRKKSKSISGLEGHVPDHEDSQISFDLTQFPTPPSPKSKPLSPGSTPSPLHLPTSHQPRHLSHPTQYQHVSSPTSTSSTTASFPVTSTPLSQTTQILYRFDRFQRYSPRQPNNTPMSGTSPLSNVARNRVTYAFSPSPAIDSRDTSTSSNAFTRSSVMSRGPSSKSSLDPITPFLTRPSSMVELAKGETSPTEVDSDEESGYEAEAEWLRAGRGNTGRQDDRYEEAGGGDEDMEISFEPPEGEWTETRWGSDDVGGIESGDSSLVNELLEDDAEVGGLGLEDLALGPDKSDVSAVWREGESPDFAEGSRDVPLQTGRIAEPMTPPRKMIPIKFGTPPPAGLDFDRSPFKELYKSMKRDA